MTKQELIDKLTEMENAGEVLIMDIEGYIFSVEDVQSARDHEIYLVAGEYNH